MNLNITGFHLVLTEHDARLPSTPCKAFYIARLHEQPWVRGDHSDIIVAMSKIFHILREEDKDVNEDLVPPSTDVRLMFRTYDSVTHQLVRIFIIPLEGIGCALRTSQL